MPGRRASRSATRSPTRESSCTAAGDAESQFAAGGDPLALVGEEVRLVVEQRRHRLRDEERRDQEDDGRHEHSRAHGEVLEHDVAESSARAGAQVCPGPPPSGRGAVSAPCGPSSSVRGLVCGTSWFSLLPRSGHLPWSCHLPHVISPDLSSRPCAGCSTRAITRRRPVRRWWS